jgi:hypothetical protein
MLVDPILLPAVTNMAIDDDRELPINSDHNWLFAKVKANYHTIKWPKNHGEDHWNLTTLKTDSFTKAFSDAQ